MVCAKSVIGQVDKMIRKTFEGSKTNAVIAELLLLQLDVNKTYDLEIKEHRKKRSLDANAYCWVLLNKLSGVLKIPAETLYRTIIHNIGAYTVVPIRNDAVEKYTQIWQANGIGWIVDNLGESKIDGYTNLKCFHGSSSYDSKEMSRLIDEIVLCCKEQGIETSTPAELALLKEEWSK